VREYAFELAMCAALEAESDGILARQLGTRSRVVDVVEVTPGPAFADRQSITAETIPPVAIESDVGAGRARYWKDAVDGGSDRVEEAIERAIERGFFEAERRNGRRYVRQTTRYPDWFDGLRAFENKPDLGRPGDLRLQLRKDCSLALFDEVVLVTGSYVTGAHLNRLPEAVGVWRFDADSGEFEVVRPAERLPTDESGIAVRDREPTRVDIEVVTAAEKRRLRRAVAERAYGKGWRPAELPGCERADAAGPPFRPDDALPYCAWKERLVEPPRECGPSCEGYEPAAPPEAAPRAERDRRSPWTADPDGTDRRQSGLDRFTEE
jgi:hypothetical protein